mgnify:CR=1 FL=1
MTANTQLAANSAVWPDYFQPIQERATKRWTDGRWELQGDHYVWVPGAWNDTTREFTVDRGQGPEDFVAVYVPTNHLYLGDIVAFPSTRVQYPDLSVEDGIRIFLTGGSSFVPAVRRLFEDRFGAAKIETGDQLVSIAHGLSLIGRETDISRWTA